MSDKRDTDEAALARLPGAMEQTRMLVQVRYAASEWCAEVYDQRGLVWGKWCPTALAAIAALVRRLEEIA